MWCTPACCPRVGGLCNLFVMPSKHVGELRESNSRPLAPKARIIPLDQIPMLCHRAILYVLMSATKADVTHGTKESLTTRPCERKVSSVYILLLQLLQPGASPWVCWLVHRCEGAWPMALLPIQLSLHQPVADLTDRVMHTWHKAACCSCD